MSGLRRDCTLDTEATRRLKAFFVRELWIDSETRKNYANYGWRRRWVKRYERRMVEKRRKNRRIDGWVDGKTDG